MNPSEYLQSRFVTSQLSVNSRPTTVGYGENHAVLAWMWITLKLTTAWFLFLIVLQYFGVLLRIAHPPRPAKDIAFAAKMAEAERRAEAEKASQEIIKDTMKQMAEESFAGTDAKKGSA